VLYQATPTQFLLKMDGIARYLVSNGNKIVVEPAPNALESDIRVFLLGSCIGTLLHQRKILALHASAIEYNGNAILFAGNSGAGKSTLLNAFLQRGYKMLTDDVAGVQIGADGMPHVLPGIPRTKLWADAAKKLERNTEGLNRTRPHMEKFEIPTFEQFTTESAPFKRLYILKSVNRDELELEPMEMRQSFGMLARYTYRSRFLDALRYRGQHLLLTTKITQHVQVVRACRPSHPYRLQEFTDLIENDFQTHL
ncbi:MAG: hypothetical protein ACPG8W_15290, partial [Candidatus Promineifilaceae bacterium]